MMFRNQVVAVLTCLLLCCCGENKADGSPPETPLNARSQETGTSGSAQEKSSVYRLGEVSVSETIDEGYADEPWAYSLGASDSKAINVSLAMEDRDGHWLIAIWPHSQFEVPGLLLCVCLNPDVQVKGVVGLMVRDDFPIPQVYGDVRGDVQFAVQDCQVRLRAKIEFSLDGRTVRLEGAAERAIGNWDSLYDLVSPRSQEAVGCGCD